MTLAMGVMFLSQTALGILGNSALLCHLILANFTGRRVKPTDLILMHLTWANFLVLVFKGIPQTMAAFSLIYFLDDVSCKLVFYFHRVARGVSLGSTSLLSVIQAITIRACNTKWVQSKIRVHKVIGPSLGLCWVLYLLVNILIPMTLTGILGTTNQTWFPDIFYCAVADPQSLYHPFYIFLLASIDGMCVALMAWSSGSMVMMLWKHKQRVQHIHSSLSPRSSPETRATQSILALGSSFMMFYVTSVIITMCFSFFPETSRGLVNANGVISACFPVFCPFLLLSQHTTISRLCSACS